MHTLPLAIRFHSLVMVLFTFAWINAHSSSGQQPYGDFEEYQLDHLSRPTLFEIPEREFVYPDDLLPLWERALEREDTQLSRLVIDSISIAHQRGFKETKKLEPKLVEIGSRENLNPRIAVSIANTLIELGNKTHAPLLASLASQYGPSVACRVEPALARWKSKELKDIWSERLANGSPSETEMIHAIQGVIAIQSEVDFENVQRLVLDQNQTASLRLVAAKELAKVRSQGLVEIARQLASIPSGNHFHRLLAIEILGQHVDSDAITFLRESIEIESNAVQSLAMQNLYRIQPTLVEDLAERLHNSEDSKVREFIIDALADAQSVARIPRLAFFLNDVNPHLRRLAASHCLALADVETLQTSVINEVVAIHSGSQWQGCEQATWILGQLKHAASGGRMVELLGHERGEVKVAAAWGLYQLRLPEHLPAMLEHAQSVWDGFQSGELNLGMRGVTLHQAFLFDAFGDQKFKPAVTLMVNYVPKNLDIGVDARVAAVWALGMIHADEGNARLSNQFIARMEDDGQFPEVEDVRNMAAVSLGRMNAESALPSLKKYSKVGLNGAQWALKEMIGQELPPMRPNNIYVDDWFLSPAISNDE